METMTAIATQTDDAPLVAQGDSLAAEVSALVVTDDTTFQRAADLSRRLAGWIKNAEEFFTPMKTSAHRTWKAICEREGAVINPKKALKTTLSERMAAYEQEQNRLRLEAEARAQREREALEAEARRLAEEERKRLTAEVEDALLTEAVEADARGDKETAERLLMAPVFIPPVSVAPVFVAPVQVETPKAAGVSFRTEWSAQLADMKELVKAAAAGNPVAMSCLRFDEVRANALARSLKDHLTIPGVKSISKRITSTRSA